MTRGKASKVMHRRVGRAVGALSVVAFAAFGPTGPALAVGTVAQTEPVASETAAALGPYVAAEVAGPNAVAATTTTATTATTDAATTAAVDDATPTVSPAAPDGTGIPSTVLAAYKAAEAALAVSNPSCHLPWNLVAGIGRVESGHASGGRVDGAGTTNGRILGPRLDGTTVGTATIRDTDAGTLDGDTAYDRAVGPMQFIPGTWKSFAKDGNNDGAASPHNVFDAALAAGSYLCTGGGDLSQPAAQRAALLRYNRSDAYGALVLRWAAAYGAGTAVLPDGTGQVPSTLPIPPAQVPTPANTTLDPAAAAALAAPAPTVTGPAASESDGGTVTTTITATPTTPTTPSSSSSSSTTPTTTTSSSTTPAPVTTTTGTTTTTTTTTGTTSTSTSTTSSTTSSTTTSTTEPTTSTGTSATSSSASSTKPAEVVTSSSSSAAKTSAAESSATESIAAKVNTAATSDAKSEGDDSSSSDASTDDPSSDDASDDNS